MKNSRKLWDQAATANSAHFGGSKMQDITTIVSTVGFPIAMCILLFWYMQKESENHKTETNSLKDAINELRIAITTLVNKLDE